MKFQINSTIPIELANGGIGSTYKFYYLPLKKDQNN